MIVSTLLPSHFPELLPRKVDCTMQDLQLKMIKAFPEHLTRIVTPQIMKFQVESFVQPTKVCQIIDHTIIKRKQYNAFQTISRSYPCSKTSFLSNQLEHGW